MKIALLGENKKRFCKVYSPAVTEKLREYGELTQVLSKRDFPANKEILRECEYVFATWGMPVLTKEEIALYLPRVKAVFYAAGTVQYFARPFIESGIRVFSAAAVNAVPVAEYTFSQICLASKGYFSARRLYRPCLPLSYLSANASKGNYGSKIGLAGLGNIGKMVARRLQELDVEVLAFDPFVSEEEARSLGVRLVDMETLFRECDVISNHLADKKELKNIYNYRLFRLMKKHSVFINTGRGGQVSEPALAFSLLLHPSRTFVGDVIKCEYFPFISPLFWCPGAVLTPHIAGSTGKEPQRMAFAMAEEMKAVTEGKEVRFEVTGEMLSKMA